LEQQARQRLTGGVILVILLVLLVPELLTGPRSAPAPAPVQPDQAPMRSYTMDLGESPRAREPVAASTAAPPAHESAVSPNSAPGSAPAPTLALGAPSPTGAVNASEPAARPPAPVAVAHGAQHPPTEHAAPEHGPTGWTVQVGTFGSRDNAAHLAATLKSHGFSPTVSEALKNGHKLFRVRVGSERDRAAAQKLLTRLKSAGQKGGEIVSTSSTIPGAVPAARRP
jgi:cell division septation protein DedD